MRNPNFGGIMSLVNGGGMTSKVWVRAITAAIGVSLLIPVCVTGQATGGVGTTGGGATGSTGGVGTTGGAVGTGGATTVGRTPSTTTTTTPTTTPTTVNIPQPIFVSGRVMLEDGTAPTEQVIIETM